MTYIGIAILYLIGVFVSAWIWPQFWDEMRRDREKTDKTKIEYGDALFAFSLLWPVCAIVWPVCAIIGILVGGPAKLWRKLALHSIDTRDKRLSK